MVGDLSRRLQGKLEPRQDYRLPVGYFSSRPSRTCARLMPRYFFILGLFGSRGLTICAWRVIALSDEAAIEAARKVTDELLAERGPEDLNPTIIVKNEAGEVIYQFPSN